MELLQESPLVVAAIYTSVVFEEIHARSCAYSARHRAFAEILIM